MRFKMNVDACLGFDLELKSPKTEGKGEYKINPIVLAVETPDGIHCSVVDVELMPAPGIRLEFKADGKIGGISLTMKLVDLMCIIETAKAYSEKPLEEALKEG